MVPPAVLALGLLGFGLSLGGVIALVLAVAALVSVLRNPDISSGSKAIWAVAIVFLPILGAIVYFGVNSER